jgi:hypothetical protein
MKTQWLSAVIVLIVLSSCKFEKEGKANMLEKDDVRKTHCIGRNLITLPSSFVESPVATGIFKLEDVEGRGRPFDVVVRNGISSIERFKTEVQVQREKLIDNEDGNLNKLRFDGEVGEGVHLFRVQEIDDAYVSELYMLRGTTIATLRLHSFHETYLQAEESLIALSKRIHVNEFGRINRKESVFCLGGVSLAGNYSAESGSFLFRDRKGASYSIDINTYASDAETPLLKRMSGPDSLLTVFNVDHKVLRARERTVAGMQAQEWLGWAKVTDEPEEKTLKFALDSMRAKPSRAAPSISLTFDTAQPLEDGTPTRTVISEDEAMRQWDAVIDSIRPAGI